MIKYVFLKDHMGCVMDNGLKVLKNGNVNMGKIAQFFKAGIAHGFKALLHYVQH